MAIALKEDLDTSLKDSGNSHESCFQFVEAQRADRLYRRVKVYNKYLQQL